MSAIEVLKRREFVGLRISMFELREADIQIESANRLNLFSYLVLRDRHRPEIAPRNSKEIG